MKVKIQSFVLILLASIIGSSAIYVLAAREEGMDSKNIAAYDCKLSSAILPWSNADGYTNASFIVGMNEINNGFTAYTYIKISSNDGKKSVECKAYVLTGTNYANSSIEIDGYRNNCSSKHQIVYSAKSVSKTVNLAI